MTPMIGPDFPTEVSPRTCSSPLPCTPRSLCTSTFCAPGGTPITSWRRNSRPWLAHCAWQSRWTRESVACPAPRAGCEAAGQSPPTSVAGVGVESRGCFDRSGRIHARWCVFHRQARDRGRASRHRSNRGGSWPAADRCVLDRVRHPQPDGGVSRGVPAARVVVLDYGSGNLRSAQRALERAGADVSVTANRSEALDCDGLVVPGVGGVRRLHARPTRRGRAADHRPAPGWWSPGSGICVGMQILFDRGVEGTAETEGCAQWPGSSIGSRRRWCPTWAGTPCSPLPPHACSLASRPSGSISCTAMRRDPSPALG